MACDYIAIRRVNEIRYGTDIGRIGPMLLANRYDDRTHFIFELLQNAEDALGKRGASEGAKSVRFHLKADCLEISHFGRTFRPEDVQGICGIAESTKDVTSIGRFGIGFKSVYAFTDRPEVHSGEEDFVIENFVWPVACAAVMRRDGETVFRLPLNPSDSTAHNEIAESLESLGPRTLLFLREIDEIAWSVDGGKSGLYLRQSTEVTGPGVHRLSLVGEATESDDIEESWLVFSEEARDQAGALAGYVELAFALTGDEGAEEIDVLEESPLVVFFPTVIETQLGFSVQGPYRTTPSRDNVPVNDDWNKGLVAQTANLLVRSLFWLRDQGLLDAKTLTSLPLDPRRFSSTSRFGPLFDAVKEALLQYPLLPAFGGGYVTAVGARLSRTQELRLLFDGAQLALLYGSDTALRWLHEDITQDKAPELRQYLLYQLDMTEVTPDSLFPKLTKQFLEAQPDNWIVKLYEYLNSQATTLRLSKSGTVPLVRLQDGTHVMAVEKGQPNAFLPSEIETSFPTVRRQVVASPEAKSFLVALGLTEPDPVDDVVRNVLPRYTGDKVQTNDALYDEDIGKVLRAFGSDSKAQRDKLVAALQKARFVRAVACSDKGRWFIKPGAVYLATEKLKSLFEGVPDVYLVDDSYSCLKGDEIREVLEACGASRYLVVEPVVSSLTRSERAEIRRLAGQENFSRENIIEDYTLRGLEALLEYLADIPLDEAATRSRSLWDALVDLHARRGASIFLGHYSWSYYTSFSASFDAEFVRALNSRSWIAHDGKLVPPSSLLFDVLGWPSEPFLMTVIQFKPPAVIALAQEVGIEPGLIDFLKQLNVTDEAGLRALLKLPAEQPLPEVEPSDDVPQHGVADETDPITEVEQSLVTEEGYGEAELSHVENGGTDAHTVGGAGSSHAGEGHSGSVSGGAMNGVSSGGEGRARAEISGAGGSRPFYTYIGLSPEGDGETEEADHTAQEARLLLEGKAVDIILNAEPELQKAPPLNEGYDLFELDPHGIPARWIEVKAMKGALSDRPVGISKAQFEYARTQLQSFWLYVVEHADDPSSARIVRIRNPVGRARTFFFDKGWADLSEAPPVQSTEGYGDEDGD